MAVGGGLDDLLPFGNSMLHSTPRGGSAIFLLKSWLDPLAAGHALLGGL